MYVSALSRMKRRDHAVHRTGCKGASNSENEVKKPPPKMTGWFSEAFQAVKLPYVVNDVAILIDDEYFRLVDGHPDLSFVVEWDAEHCTK